MMNYTILILTAILNFCFACGPMQHLGHETKAKLDQPVHSLKYWDASMANADHEMYFHEDEYDIKYFTNFFINFSEGIAEKDGELSEAYEVMQKWIDQIDGYLRSRYLSDAIPKPSIIITNQNTINGYVTPIRICFERNLRLKGTSYDPELASNPELKHFRPRKAALQFDLTLSATVSDSNNLDCIKVDYGIGKQNKIIKDLLGCSVHDETIDVQTCKGEIQDSLAGLVTNEVKMVSYSPLAKYLIFPKGILSLSSEEAFSLLAHELGHYYWAHSWRSGPYRYFYSLEQHLDIETRPVALNDAKMQQLIVDFPVMQYPSKLLDIYDPTMLDEISERLRKNHFALYTNEREAENFSLTTLAYVGIDPNSLITKNIRGDLFSSPTQEDIDCLNMYQNGFPGIPEIDFVKDPHQGNCFRLHLSDRIIKQNRPSLESLHTIDFELYKGQWKNAADSAGVGPAPEIR